MMKALSILVVVLLPALTALAQDTPLTNKFPTALNSNDSLGRTADGPQATLSSTIDSSSTSFTVIGSASSFPASGLSLKLDNEIILCTTRSGTTFSGCTRGQKGTSATTHVAGTMVRSPILSAQRDVLVATLLTLEAKLGFGSSNAASAVTGDCLRKQADGTTTWASCAPSSMVSSFNGRTGVVSLLPGDVTGVLGFTPAANQNATIKGLLDITHISPGDGLARLAINGVTVIDTNRTGIFAKLNATNGSDIENLNGANIASGTIAPARLITGIIVNSRCLRVDSSGQIAIHSTDCGSGGGGGGGTPGGSDTHVQFNDGSAFGGDAGFVFNKTTDVVTLGGGLKFAHVAAPAAPASGFTQVYSDSSDKNVKAKDDAGNVAVMVRPDAGSSNQFLTGITTAGVISKAQPAFANLSGNISVSQMNGGSGASSSTYWRGDGAWAQIQWAHVSKTGSSLADLGTRSASDLTSGTLPDARFPADLDITGSITAGTNMALGGSSIHSWASGNAIERNNLALYFGNSNDLNLVSNAYYDGGVNWKYASTAAAITLSLNAGDANFLTAASGSANSTFSWSTRWSFKNAGEILPGADNVYDIGNDSFRVRTLKLGTSVVTPIVKLGSAGDAVMARYAAGIAEVQDASANRGRFAAVRTDLGDDNDPGTNYAGNYEEGLRVRMKVSGNPDTFDKYHGVNSWVNIYDLTSSTTGQQDVYAFNGEAGVSASGNTFNFWSIFGANNVAFLRGSGNINDGLIGSISRANVFGSGTIAKLRGAQGFVQTFTGSTSTATLAQALYGIISNDAAGATLTTAAAVDGLILNNAGTIGNAYVLRARAETTGSGTVTGNRYGLFIADQGVGTVNGTIYNFYSAGTSRRNVIEGNLDVNNTTLIAGLRRKRTAVTGNTTLAITDGYVAVNCSSACTLTLPDLGTAESGAEITIADESNGATTNNISIVAGGSDTFISGISSPVVIDVNNGVVTLLWTGTSSTAGWRLK